MGLEKLERIHRWNIGQQSPPYKMIICPTNRCNLECPYCPNSHGRTVMKYRASDELTDEQWYNLVQEALDIGVKEFYVVGGGEPLLRKDMVMNLCRMIKVHNKEHFAELITNGYFFTPRDAELMVRRKLIDKITFSVDGHTAEIHDSLRSVQGAWKRTTGAMRHIHEYKQSRGSDKPLLVMNYVVTNRNHTHLPEMVELCHELGVAALSFQPLRECGGIEGNFEEFKLSKEQEKEMLRELNRARTLAERHGIYLDVSLLGESVVKGKSRPEGFLDNPREGAPHLSHSKTVCYEPLYTIFIDPQGNANFCCNAGDSVDSQNVARSGLMNIWYGAYLTAIRQGMLAGRGMPQCRSCGMHNVTLELKQDLRKYVGRIIENDHYLSVVESSRRS